MTHMAACVWCGLSVETRSPEESVDLITEHVFRCEEGPVNACLEILAEHANPETTEKAKEAIRCRLIR